MALTEKIGEKDLDEEKNLLKIVKKRGIKIKTLCGGKGLCGKCKIKDGKENISQINEKEKQHLSKKEITKGFRLACQTRIKKVL